MTEDRRLSGQVGVDQAEQRREAADHQVNLRDFQNGPMMQSLRLERIASNLENNPNGDTSIRLGKKKDVVLGHQLMSSIRLNELQVCPLCLVDFEEPCTITILGCNDLHFFHTECIDGFLQHNEKYKKPNNCPLCRVPVVKYKMKKKVYKGLKEILNPQDIIVEAPEEEEEKME